jgi:hypothetical protein
VRNAHRHHGEAPFAGAGGDLGISWGRSDGRELQDGPVGVRGAPGQVRAGIGLDPHLSAGEAQAAGEARRTERGVAAHGGARAVAVEVDHADRTGVRTEGHEHDSVGADACAPGTDGPYVGLGPVLGPRQPPVDHDEVVAGSRHLVDRQAG